MTDRELMQMALDAIEGFYPSLTELHNAHTKTAEALRARLAQPEPEPVAWMYDWYDETEDIDGVPIGGIVHDWISKDYDEAHSPTMGCHNIRPLYTAPPQREWQGLTDDEIVEIAATPAAIPGAYVHCFARAIEAKLKEKNT